MAEPNAAPPPPPQQPVGSAAPPSPAAAQAAAANLPPLPPLVPIYQGSVSHWMAFSSYVMALVMIVIGLTALIFGSYRHSIGQANIGRVPIDMICIIGGLALVLASAIMAVYTSFRVKSNRYTITTRLIERESGVLVKKVDALDLGRVKHVDMTQSFIERVVNVGTIEVFSGDQQEPQLLIEDIPDPRPVYEKLRDAVIDLSRRRGIIIE